MKKLIKKININKTTEILATIRKIYFNASNVFSPVIDTMNYKILNYVFVKTGILSIPMAVIFAKAIPIIGIIYGTYKLFSYIT